MGNHRLANPVSEGCPEPCPEPSPDDDGLDVEQVHRAGRREAESPHGAIDEVGGEVVALVEGLGPDAARHPGSPLLLHDRDEIAVLALGDATTRLGLHRGTAGVRLEAAPAAAGTRGPVGLDHHVADLSGCAAPEPELIVDHDAAADSGAAEDPEHRGVRAPRSEPRLGHDTDLDVVGQLDGDPERGT